MRKFIKPLIALGIIVTLSAGWSIYYHTNLANNLPRKLSVGEKMFSNTSTDELYKSLDDTLADSMVTITSDIPGVTVQAKAKELGIAVDKAALTKLENPSTIQLPRLFQKSNSYDVPLSIDSTKLDAALNNFKQSDKYKKPANATFQYKDNNLTIQPGLAGYGVSANSLGATITSQLSKKLQPVQVKAAFEDIPILITENDLEQLSKSAQAAIDGTYKVGSHSLTKEEIASILEPTKQDNKVTLQLNNSNVKSVVDSLAQKQNVAPIKQVTTTYKSGKAPTVTTKGVDGKEVNNAATIVSELSNAVHKGENYTGQLSFETIKFTTSTIVVDDLPKTRIVTYQVASWGNVRADFAAFTSAAAQTLNDKRGWAVAGITFQQVQSGGNFTLVLSEPARVAAASPSCDNFYSCRVGRNVIINDDRWLGATPPWTGSLRDYQHMVVNHEVGHWFGRGHAHCSGAGQPAPVMQQQSISLQGCTFNPWPLASEISSIR